MKKISASLMLAGLVSAAVAQTNAPETRALSLQDCIAEALQHNFDVRYERYEPLKSQISLDAAYAGYDPTFNISGAHNYNQSGGSFLNGFQRPSEISDANQFNSSLGGLLPSGTTYNFRSGERRVGE